MAGLGIYVSLKPQPEKRHKALIGGFAVLGLVGIVSSAALQVRSSNALDRRLGSIEETGKKLLEFLPSGSTQELKKESTVKQQTEAQPPRTTPSTTSGKTKAKKPSEPQSDEPKIIQDLKNLIDAQRWGLDADHLILLTQREAQYASSYSPAADGSDLITAILGNQDSVKFAQNLVAAFRGAGWNLPGSGFSQAIFSGPVQGVIIKIHSKDSSPPGMGEFVATLREGGIEPRGELDEGVSIGSFRIIVGSKPEQR